MDQAQSQPALPPVFFLHIPKAAGTTMAEFEEFIPRWNNSVRAKAGKVLFNLRRTTSKLKRRIKDRYLQSVLLDSTHRFALTVEAALAC